VSEICATDGAISEMGPGKEKAVPKGGERYHSLNERAETK
jgi:hypothetical protein